MSMSTTMEPSQKFWDQIADRYSKQPVANEKAYQKKLKKTQEYLRPDMQVVEFGCGTGSTAIVHAPYVSHIRATDLSESMLEIARDKAAAAGITNVTFERVSVEEFAVEDDAVDVAMTHSLLHLLADKEAALEKIYRILKPGGVFVSNTVCMGNRLWFLAPVLFVARLLGYAPMVKIFTFSHLERAITKAGFAIDYKWSPDKWISLFIIAKKPE